MAEKPILGVGVSTAFVMKCRAGPVQDTGVSCWDTINLCRGTYHNNSPTASQTT